MLCAYEDGPCLDAGTRFFISTTSHKYPRPVRKQLRSSLPEGLAGNVLQMSGLPDELNERFYALLQIKLA